MIPCKSPQEIEIMREGGKILHNVLQETLKKASAGVSTKELDLFAEGLIRRAGGIPSFKGYNGFPGTLCTSVNDQVVHGIPSDYRLKEGDIIGIDCGVFYKGLHTDSCYTIIIGSVDSNIEFFLNTVKKALHKAIRAVGPGNRVGDISNAIEKVIRQAGYAPVRELTGHGVGKELHEDPEIPNFGKKGRGDILKTGMTLAIEPIANMGEAPIKTLKDGWTICSLDGSLSGHFEHTVLVSDQGVEILT